MKVLVTGATGFVGRQLCAALAAAGHPVGVLSRDPERARSTMDGIEMAWSWAPPEKALPDEALRWADGVVHLAGESVAGRWTDDKRARIMDSRVSGTRQLVDGIAGLPAGERPRVLVSASAIGYYGDRADAELNEQAGPGDDFLAGVCVAWEAEAARAERHGVRTVRVRIGVVLGHGGGALAELLPLFRRGLGGRLGNGLQWWAWVHIADVVGAMRHALEVESVTGALNLTAPRPLRQKAFAKTLGRVLGRPSFLPAPAFALRALLGGFSTELLASRRVVPDATRAAGYAFRFPELRGALEDLLSGDDTPPRRPKGMTAMYGEDDEAL